MLATLPYLERIAFPSLTRASLSTLQVNLGYRCNLQCNHCHVNAGPNRNEAMTVENIETVIALAKQQRYDTLDLTGGAPELHPQFRYLISAVRACGIHVIDRCNLTILEEPGQEGLAEFLAAHRVEVVASLPCYIKQNVESQRGAGSFDASIRALQRLNALGYGREQDKRLNLVFNPQGAMLPPPQQALEADYKNRLREDHGIDFNRLLTITNMPIQRFGSALISRGEFDGYMQLLRDNYAPQNLTSVMCHNLLSVDWQGILYDCDFNQMLGLPIRDESGAPIRLVQLASVDLVNHPIEVRGHCYGCTAGQGSSCGGAL